MVWRRLLYPIVIILVAALAAFSGVFAGSFMTYQIMSKKQTSTSTPVASQVTAIPASNDQASQTGTAQILTITTTQIDTTITQVVDKVGSSVVTVVCTVPGQSTFFGRSSEMTVSGSGVFISKDGYVLTNNHVVEGATKVTIVLADGSQQPATIVGTDQYADLAVLKTTGKVTGVAVLGNSDVLKPGETVIAIGSPLGDFKNTVTVGVVSATGRSIDTGNGYTMEGLIQTDAAINQGNSGGPLLNLAGQVIGINTLIVRNSGSGAVAEGLGFSIPVNTARTVADQIIQQGYFSRPYLGVTAQDITPNIAARYNLPVDWGAYVTDVTAGSPAALAGIQQGDIVTAVDGVAVDGTHSYVNLLFTHKVGDKITLDFNRDGAQKQVNLTLTETKANGQ